MKKVSTPAKRERPIKRRSPWPVRAAGYLARPKALGQRIMQLPGWDSLCFHVQFRTQRAEKCLSEVEREFVVIQMKRWSSFLGLKLLTYCVMPSSVDLLVRVPNHTEALKLFQGRGWEWRFEEHLEAFYPVPYMAQIRSRLSDLRASGRSEEATALLERMRDRQGSLLFFIARLKALTAKMRPWKGDERGPFWSLQSRIAVVEDRRAGAVRLSDAGGRRDALRLMAIHIELTPLRLGLIGQAGAYRWTGWASAKGGDGVMIEGLCDIIGCSRRQWSPVGRERFAAWVGDSVGVTKGKVRADKAQRGAATVPLHERVAHAISILARPEAVGFPEFVKLVEAEWLRLYLENEMDKPRMKIDDRKSSRDRGH